MLCVLHTANFLSNNRQGTRTGHFYMRAHIFKLFFSLLKIFLCAFLQWICVLLNFKKSALLKFFITYSSFNQILFRHPSNSSLDPLYIYSQVILTHMGAMCFHTQPDFQYDIKWVLYPVECHVLHYAST